MLLNLKIFLDILKFTKGPQDLPSRPNLLNIVIIANIAVGLITIDPKIDYLINIFFAVIYIIVTIFFIQIGLKIKEDNSLNDIKYKSRYLQVCSGILGIHALIAFTTSIVALIIDPAEMLLMMLFLILSLYAWFVNGHIFRNAFDTTMTFGLGISLLHSIACVFVMMIFIQVLFI
tara:strand:+ start:593 stop:1117 length:525 start_codon:yes stop_codon:yes gene_type:complete